VFCVSNRWYEEYTRKSDPTAVNASGIPALRSYCYSLTAQSQLDAAKNFLESRIPNLLCSLQMQLESEWKGARQQVLLRIVENHQRNTTERVKDFDLNTIEILAENLFSYDQRAEEWKTAALDIVHGWEKWAHSSYDAWQENYISP
jgi:hypothetical protein